MKIISTILIKAYGPSFGATLLPFSSPPSLVQCCASRAPILATLQSEEGRGKGANVRIWNKKKNSSENREFSWVSRKRWTQSTRKIPASVFRQAAHADNLWRVINGRGGRGGEERRALLSSPPLPASSSFSRPSSPKRAHQKPQRRAWCRLLLARFIFHSQAWSISNFTRSLTRNITSHSKKNLAFHSLLKWKWLYYQFSPPHLYFSLTLSLPRVISFKFPLRPHQKYYITQYEELGFS